jgi:hypothetical protein
VALILLDVLLETLPKVIIEHIFIHQRIIRFILKMSLRLFVVQDLVVHVSALLFAESLQLPVAVAVEQRLAQVLLERLLILLFRF